MQSLRSGTFPGASGSKAVLSLLLPLLVSLADDIFAIVFAGVLRCIDCDDEF
jgi:hypothetical protein